MPTKFVRICQDITRNRDRCMDRARRVLADGKVTVIDRTNLDAQQRKHWIGFAKDIRGGPFPCCVVFKYGIVRMSDE